MFARDLWAGFSRFDLKQTYATFSKLFGPWIGTGFDIPYSILPGSVLIGALHKALLHSQGSHWTKATPS